MVNPGDDKYKNRYGFHATPSSEMHAKHGVNSETGELTISKLNKLFDSASKAASLNPGNQDNKDAVDTLQTCITACKAALKSRAEVAETPAAETSESRHTFGR